MKCDCPRLFPHDKKRELSSPFLDLLRRKSRKEGIVTLLIIKAHGSLDASFLSLIRVRRNLSLYRLY